MIRIALATVIVVATACGRDPNVDKLSKRIDELSQEVDQLKQQAAEQQTQHPPAEAPLPERPHVGEPTVPACRDYLAAVESYLECDKVKGPVRDAVRESLTKMRATWSADMSDDARKAAASGCAAATEALQKGAATLGCPPHAERGP